MDSRQTCLQQFQNDVERMFSNKYLRKTTITFDCGIWYNSEAFGGKVNLRSISFGFDRLANEGETAVFKTEDCAEEYLPEIMKRVSSCVARSSVEQPGHVNDTEVPDLAVDKEAREISFNWRAMFSQFFAEEKLKDYYFKQHLTDEGTGASKGLKLREKVDRGEISQLKAMEAAFAIAGRGFDESKKLARRARICRQWEAEGQDCIFDEDFEEEEKAALKALKETEFYAGFMESSDDEAEEKAELEEEEEEDDDDDDDYYDDAADAAGQAAADSAGQAAADAASRDAGRYI